MTYGRAPIRIDVPEGKFDFDLPEVMYYLYLPVRMMGKSGIRLPNNLECCRPLIERAMEHAGPNFSYVYISARKGWASPDNPLNRPGWHCDGFGSHDMNYIWWRGPGTRFAIQDFGDISPDHFISAEQFETRVKPECIEHPESGHLYALDPYVVHSTPLIKPPGCMRQFVKVSLSNERYNLKDNSHNYLFNYEWPLHSRDEIRNDPHKSQLDYVK